MEPTRVKMLDGGVATLDRDVVDGLARGLDGGVAFPGDQIYVDATAIWNGMIEKRPAMVVRARSVPDVVRTVDFARRYDLELSIRGGGHNIAGLALSDGGLTLDLSAMRDVDVDVERRRARVQGGCTLGDVDKATQAHGLATALGFVSETGVAGLTLGGGFGYLTRQFGWTVDDLEEAEVVTAAGEVLRCSRTENPDLLWALRGGGGNFGVVTEFVFRLHQVGPEVTAGLIAWPAEEAEGVLELYRRTTEAAPRELTVAVLMRNAPPAPWLPEDKHGKPMIAFVVNHTGSERQAADDLAPVRAFGEPWADLIQVKEYVAQQSMLDATQPKGMQYYWKSEFLPGLTDEVLAVYREQFVGLEAPANQIVLFHLEGALAEHPEDDGAVGNRDAEYACVVQSMFPPESPASDENRRWVRSAWEALKPFSTGGNYINFQTAEEAEDRLGEAYRANFERLARIKGRYDPGNLFRVNRNILPAS